MQDTNITFIPKIRNNNFINNRMDYHDIEFCFVLDGQVRPFINSLIAGGYIKKTGDRYYKPTDKLLELAFLPAFIQLQPEQRKFLTKNSTFTSSQLKWVFNTQMINSLMRQGLIYTDANQRFRKSEGFTDYLVEGNDIIRFKDGEGI
jgi:hypothetical protein